MPSTPSILPKHEDWCTLLTNTEDRDILTRRGFDVNMRLFRVNPRYRNLIEGVCHYLRWCTLHEKEGYSMPKGYSGANAGIPFNIIAIRDGSTCEVIINPEVAWHTNEVREVTSNCGSLRLPSPIRVRRWTEVVVQGFDEDGNHISRRGFLPTHQHEIDHNLGILITARQPVEDMP